MASQRFFKDLATGLSALRMGHLIEAKGLIDIGITLDNKSRGVFIKLIGMGPDPTVLSLFKYKGKSIAKALLGTEPDKVITAHIDSALEGV